MPIANYASLIKTFLQPNYLYGSVRYPFKGAYNLFDVYLNEALLATDDINTVTTFGSLSGDLKWVGGVLAPNGCIYGIPFDSTSVLKIDPLTDTATTFGSLSSTANKWGGGVLAPNGYIYGIPFDSTSVLKIDPLTDTATTFGSLSGNEKWAGGVLAPNGYIYGIPFDSTSVLEIQTNIYSKIDQKLLSAYSNKY